MIKTEQIKTALILIQNNVPYKDVATCTGLGYASVGRISRAKRCIEKDNVIDALKILQMGREDSLAAVHNTKLICELLGKKFEIKESILTEPNEDDETERKKIIYPVTREEFLELSQKVDVLAKELDKKVDVLITALKKMAKEMNAITYMEDK